MKRAIQFYLLFLIGLGALAGLYAAALRVRVENRNRAVELAVEYSEVKALAHALGTRTMDALRRLKSAGVTSLSISEDTLGGLAARGAFDVSQSGSETRIRVHSPALLERIQSALAARRVVHQWDMLPRTASPPESVTIFESGQAAPQHRALYVANADFASLDSLGIGLDPDAVGVAREVGLRPVARIANFPGASSETMRNTLRALREQGVQTVIFLGAEVLGFRGLYREAAAALDGEGVLFGQVEFGKQKGEDRLGAALDGRFVRVHSIGEAELAGLSDGEVVDRFARAARERNIRLCYLRLPISVGEDPIAANAEIVARLARTLQRQGRLAPGAARPFGDPGAPHWVFLLIGAGTAAGAVLLVLRVITPPPGSVILISVGALILCVGLAAAGETGRKLLALLAAVIFPTLACLRRDILSEASGSPARLSMRVSASRALAGFAVASAVTAVGIAYVVGLLATRPFLVKVEQFMGIKAAHAIPILLIGALAILGLPRLSRPWREEWDALLQRASRVMGEPARVGQILLSIAALIVLALIVARTGNEPGVGVSGVEMRFRALLDQTLGVRPRTKEFLLGHPSFVMALAFWFRGRRGLALPLFVVGVIGQVSLLNTFCHIHTPLVVSVIRALTGLALGALIGLAVFFALEPILARRGRGAALQT